MVEYSISNNINIHDLVGILRMYLNITIINIFIYDSNKDPNKLWNIFSVYMKAEDRYAELNEAYEKVMRIAEGG